MSDELLLGVAWVLLSLSVILEIVYIAAVCGWLR